MRVTSDADTSCDGAAHARAAEAELERFSYAVSHDLQAPVRHVNGFLSLLAKKAGDTLDAEAQDYLDRAVRAGHRLQVLLAGVLALSRIRPDRTSVARCDTQRLLGRVLDEMRDAIAGAPATITALPLPEVLADPDQVQLVLEHLLDNAVKFGRKGGVRIDVAAERAGPLWRFTIRDDGTGFDPGAIEHAFALFGRVHGVEIPGAGIGLALCKKAIEANGGSIAVETAPDAGCAVSFTLPAAA